MQAENHASRIAVIFSTGRIVGWGRATEEAAQPQMMRSGTGFDLSEVFFSL